MKRASRWFWPTLLSALLLFVFVKVSFHPFTDDDSVAAKQVDVANVPTRLQLETNEKIAQLQKIIDAIPPYIASDEDTKRHASKGFRHRATNSSIVDVDLHTSLDPSLIEKVTYSYLKQLQVTCPKQTRMGRQEDGGWDVCIGEPFAITKPCLAYSIGMGGEWSFDEMITTQYGCQDMTYDPTIGKKDHKPNALFWFFNTGLGKTDTVNDKNWKLRTFPTLLTENNHTQTTIDILKMDIEYAEWESLEAILANPSCLKNVKQLMIEFHTRELNAGQHSSVVDLVYYWHLARGIDRLGFKIWNVWENGVCNFDSVFTPGLKLCGCFNVYYINTRLL